MRNGNELFIGRHLPRQLFLRPTVMYLKTWKHWDGGLKRITNGDTMTFHPHMTVRITMLVCVFGIASCTGDRTTETNQSASLSTRQAPMASNATNDAYPGLPVDAVMPMVDIQSRVVYPEVARENRIEGRVVVSVLIGKDGRPVKSRVEYADNNVLETAAIDAVMSSTFTPGSRSGKPAALWVSIPIMFKLD